MSDIDSTDPENAWYEDSGRAATHRQRAAMYEQAIENGEVATKSDIFMPEMNQAEVDQIEINIARKLIELRRDRVTELSKEIDALVALYPELGA